MSKRKHAKQRKNAPVLTAKQQEFKRAEHAMRSFYSNAVSWGSNLTGASRDEYSLDDATVARLYAITVTSWICANYRAVQEAAIPPQVVNAAGAVIEEADNPLMWLIDNHIDLMFKISISLLIWGKFYLRKVRNLRDVPTRLEWLNPLDVSPMIDYQRNKFIGFRVQGRDNEVKPEDMIVGLTFDPLNDFDGVSPYEVAMRQIVGGRELVRFGQKYFQEGTMLGGMLTYEGELTDEEYKEVKAEFGQFKGSQNAFKTFVAGGGLAKFDYKAMQPNPVDLAMPDFKDMLDGDTCRAFGVNPILVGIGDAKDPLSAQNTYEQIEDKFVLNTAVPRVRWIFEHLTKQWLAVDFRAWGDLRLEPDLSEINAASKAQPERSTTAVANVGRIWSVNEGRDYTGRPPREQLIQYNPDWAIAMYNAGGTKLSEFRRAVGIEAVLDIDGLIWQIDPRASGQQSQLSFNVGHQPGQIAEPAVPKALPAVAGSRAATACYVLLSLANNAHLMEVQNVLRAQYPAVEWTPAKDFHVTLVHTPIAADLGAIKTILPKSINPFTIATSELDTFEGQDKQPLILRVDAEQTLVALQNGLAASFQALGLELSPYSEADAWQPHITLGYIQAGQPLPKWDRPVTLTSATLICSIENGDSFQSIAVTRSQDGVIDAEILPTSPMRADPLLTKAQLYELDNWRKKVQHKGSSAAFDHKHLPDTLATFVRSELAEQWNPRAVFDEAKQAIKYGRDARPIGATEEEALEFWRDFDNLQTDLGSAWLDYMKAVSALVFENVAVNPQIDITAVLDRSHGMLADAWVGTLEAPGPMLSLTLAGMKAGDHALQREVAANPNRPARAFDVGVSWNLLSDQAITFSRSYTYSLIRRIDDTTRAGIRDAVSQGIEQGLSGDAVRDLIANVLVPSGGEITDAVRYRAQTIGDTESMHAFVSGSFQRWQDAGVTEATWQTVRDNKVCATCRSLHGMRARINEGWLSPVTGQRYTVSAHVKDRCFRRPAV